MDYFENKNYSLLKLRCKKQYHGSYTVKYGNKFKELSKITDLKGFFVLQG